METEKISLVGAMKSLLFWEVRTCQNPCAAAGVILWATEPNQPEKSPAASLPGPLAR